MMRRMMGAAVALVLLVGCSSSDDDPAIGSGNGTCALRSGSYVTTFVTRSGNCGEIPETIGNVTTQPTDGGPGCTGGITYSTDNCEVRVDTKCPGTGSNSEGKVSVTGLAKWSTDGALGHATETLTITDAKGDIVCLGTYDLTQRRQ